MARKKKLGDIQCAPFPMTLKKALAQDGATQVALASYVGVTPQTVSQYCSGASEPSFDNLVKIARFFDCSTDFLLGLSASRWGS